MNRDPTSRCWGAVMRLGGSGHMESVALAVPWAELMLPLFCPAPLPASGLLAVNLWLFANNLWLFAHGLGRAFGTVPGWIFPIIK